MHTYSSYAKIRKNLKKSIEKSKNIVVYGVNKIIVS